MVRPTTVRAVFEDGVFKPQEPVQLREHTPVDVLVPVEADAKDDGWKAWKRFSGLWKDAAETDIAESHDKYLHE